MYEKFESQIKNKCSEKLLIMDGSIVNYARDMWILGKINSRTSIMSDIKDLFDFTNCLRDYIDQLKVDIENFQYPTLNDSFDTEIDPEIRNDKLRWGC